MALTEFKVKSGYFVFFNQFLERVTYLVFYIILARIVSKNEYGALITIFAFSNIIQILFDFGIPFYLQREIASGRDYVAKLNPLLTIKYLSLPMIICIELIYLSLIQNMNPVWVMIISSANYLQSLNQIYNSIFYGKERYKESLTVNLISKIFYFLLVLILIFLNSGVVFFLSCLIISNIYLLYKQRTILLSKISLQYKFVFKLEGLREILPSSLKIGAGLIFVTIYDRVDILIIQMLMSYENVAAYSVAYSLFRSVQIFGTAVLMPAYTKYSALYSKKNFLNFSDIKFECYSLIMFSLAVIFFSGVFGELIIRLVFGVNYSFSGMILFILTFALPGAFMNNLTGVISNSSRKEKIPLITTGAGVLIGITCNFILIPLIGIYGAVTATIITEYSVFLFQLIFLIKSSKNKPRINGY
ncbi:MAG: oligosaccharide flippase family protein [Ignavibacteriales bacterium]|nr:oligosaccharide flippase family protein [Ignavibacteriales bacterium]